MKISVRQLRQIIREQVEISVSSTAKRHRSLESNRLSHLLEKDDTKDTEFLKTTRDTVSIKEEQQAYNEWKSKNEGALQGFVTSLGEQLEKLNTKMPSKEKDNEDAWHTSDARGMIQSALENPENDFGWLQSEIRSSTSKFSIGSMNLSKSYWGAIIKDMYLLGIMESFDEKSNIITINSTAILDDAFSDNKVRSAVENFVNKVRDHALSTGLTQAILGRDIEKSDASTPQDLSSEGLVTDKEEVEKTWKQAGGKKMDPSYLTWFVLDPKSRLRPVAVRSESDRNEIMDRLGNNQTVKSLMQDFATSKAQQILKDVKKTSDETEALKQLSEKYQKLINRFYSLTDRNLMFEIKKYLTSFANKLKDLAKEENIGLIFLKFGLKEEGPVYGQLIGYALSKTTPEQVETAFNEMLERLMKKLNASEGGSEADELIRGMLSAAGIKGTANEVKIHHGFDQPIVERWQRLAGILKG